MIIDRDQLAAALPSYEVRGELGRGGFGLVVAAQHRQLGRDVAIKVLAVGDEVAHARFVAEARLLARMDHRHIVRVHDYVEHGGLCLIIMELLGGGSLTRHLAGIPAREACAVGVAVAEALSYAHAQGVLHRDIKPDNVLFDAAGLLKVTDFGIAKIFDGSPVSASMVAGTPAYMAPEQIRGDQLGPATDIYALGVVLYQMLAGTLPFDPALPLFNRYEQQLATMPPPPAGVPPAVAEAVMHALARDMQARPRSAKDFAFELAAAADRGYGPSSISASRIPLGAARHARVTTAPSASGEVPEALAISRSIAEHQPAADQRGIQPVGPGRSAAPPGKRRTRWAWVALAVAVAAAGVFLAVRLPPAIASHSGQPGQTSPTVKPGQSGPVITPSTGSVSTVVPTITNVAISGAAGDYELTITGSGFGSPAASLPLDGDLPNFRIADSAQVGSGEWGYDGDGHPLDYQVWTGNRIVVSGLGANPGNALVLALWNQNSGQGVTWGGDVPPAATPGPVISSVQFTGTPSNPQIIIRGSGFGTAPIAMPYTGSIQSFAIGDWRAYHAGSGPSSTWTSGVTEKFLSWSPTTIALGGFSGTFGQQPNVLEPGDPLSIQIWSPASSYDTGPQTAWGGRASATLASATFSWAQANPAMSPSGRQYAAMAYDAATRQMVLFSGGIGGGGPQSPDTWIWNGTNWSQATPRISPSAREGAVLAYDGATRQLVLFGGETGTNSGLLSDTWTWDGANWIQLDPATSPPARYAASMTYDPATRQLVLFGGFGAADNSDNLNDTWTWNGTDWTPEHPATSPAARVNAGLAYNPHDAGIVLYGGTGPSPFGQAAPPSDFFSDTWLWNGTDWIQEHPVTSPPARTNVCLVYDQAAGQDILFGGIGSDGSSLGDTWAWDGSTWNQITTSTSPSARSVGAMAYDGATRQVVLFSGWNGSAPDDTWNLGA